MDAGRIIVNKIPLSRKGLNMKSNLFFRIRFYYVILNTKATILMLYLKNINNKERRDKVKSLQDTLERAKQFL